MPDETKEQKTPTEFVREILEQHLRQARSALTRCAEQIADLEAEVTDLRIEMLAINNRITGLQEWLGRLNENV